MAETFKITSAGFYRQRDGGKAEVVGQTTIGRELGRWLGLNAQGFVMSWPTRGGHAWYPADTDLVAPWTEAS